MAASATVVVDLTGDDSPPRPSHGASARNSGVRPGSMNGGARPRDEDDDDVTIVSAGQGDHGARPKRRRTLGAEGSNNMANADEDVAITGTIGELPLRDLPHPRCDCVEHAIVFGTSTSNALHCSQCYCYVCDVKAAECSMWGTGAQQRDHCNARKASSWDHLRSLARGGRMAEVRAAYDNPASSSSVATAPETLDLSRPSAALPALLPRKSAIKPSSSKPQAPAKLAPAKPKQPPAVTAAKAGAWLNLGASSSGSVRIPPGLVVMPDPALDNNAIELGSFTFNVETATSSITIAQLTARLIKTGFFIRRLPNHQVADNLAPYGDTLFLHNIFELSNPMSYRSGNNDSFKHLKIVDEPDYDEGPPLSDERVRQVTVIDSVGRVLPIILGVKVHKDARCNAIIEAIKPQLHPPFDAAIETLLVTETYGMAYYSDSVPRLIPESTEMNDRFHSSHQLILYRLPKLPPGEAAAPPPVKPPLPAPLNIYGGAAPRSSPPQYVAFALRQRMTRTVPGRSGSSRRRNAAFGFFMGLQDDYYDDDSSGYSDDDDGYCPDCGCYHDSGHGGGRSSETTVIDIKKHGMTILLPVAERHTHSGPEANAALSKALEQALRPYLKEEAPAAEADAADTTAAAGAAAAGAAGAASGAKAGAGAGAATKAGDKAGAGAKTGAGAGTSSSGAGPSNGAGPSSSAGPSGSGGAGAGSFSFKLLRGHLYYSYEAGRDFYDVPGRILECSNTGIANMTAIWDGNDSLNHYAFELLSKPEVDESATKEALQETADVVEEERKREDARRARSNLRWELVDELKSACSRYDPSDKQGIMSQQATAAVTLQLQPLPGGTPRQGLLKFTVYAWTRDGPGYRSMFQQWDDFGAASARGGDAFSLRKTMKFLMKDAPGAEAMWSQLEDVTKACYAASDVRSVNGLLRFLQTPERTAAVQPDGLTVQMRSYQLQSLQFMLDAEARDGGYRSVFWVRKVNTQGRTFWYSPVMSRASLSVPEQPAGGFLAEEMGLGKTVEVLALILAAPPPPTLVNGTPHGTSGERIVSRATLVVCAVSLVGQWVEEAQSKSAGSLRILQYHGQNRMKDYKKIASSYDLVVTTYQTLASDYSRQGKNDIFEPLGRIHWFRIVFDEGHMVKTVAAQQSKVCVGLSSDRRWCCTGTPIGTGVEDLLGQFAAINMVPMNTKMFFDMHIKSVFGNAHRHYGNPDVSPVTLLYTLKQSMIRHTKAQVLNGEVVLQLPPKTQEDIAVTLTAAEQQLYKEVCSKVQEKWKLFRAAGAATVTKYQLTIMSMLGPLRRICSGGLLKQEDLAVPDLEPESLSKSAVATLMAMAPNADLVSPESECSICLDTMENPVVTPCQHWFCRECITSWLDQKDTCTLCRGKLNMGQLRSGVMPGYKPPEAGNPDDEAGPSEPVTHACESKLRVLLAELRAMRAADSTAKALVFSQYNTTLEWLKKRLTEEGFGYRTISGSMPLKQRTKAIEAFQKDPPTTVFLLSMRSGAVGINLTAASHVFIMEPCLNPALEEQAIGRSWRMGQKRNVVVKRFYIKESVEAAIMDVVKARREAGARLAGTSSGGDAADEAAITAAAQALLDEEQAAGGRRRGGLQRAIADVVAGNIKSDKQMLKMNELEMLFAAPSFSSTAEQEEAKRAAERPAATPEAPATVAQGLEAEAGAEEAGPSSVTPAAATTTAGRPRVTGSKRKASASSAAAAAAAARAAGSSVDATPEGSGGAVDMDVDAAMPADGAGGEASVSAPATTGRRSRATSESVGGGAAAAVSGRSRRARKVHDYAAMLKGEGSDDDE